MKAFKKISVQIKSANYIKLLLYIFLLLEIFITLTIGYIVFIEVIYSNSIFASVPKYLNELIIGLGVLIALITLLWNSNKSNSKDYLNKATSLLEQSFNIFSENLDEKGAPPNDRVLWLTVARMIQSSIDLSKKITIYSHKKIFNETLQFWRWKFSLLLKLDKGSFPSNYFAESPEIIFSWDPRRNRAPLSLKSLRVIYRFIKWPKDLEDPLEKSRKFTSEEIKDMLEFGPHGLGELLEAVEKIRTEQNISK